MKINKTFWQAVGVLLLLLSAQAVVSAIELDTPGPWKMFYSDSTMQGKARIWEVNKAKMATYHAHGFVLVHVRGTAEAPYPSTQFPNTIAETKEIGIDCVKSRYLIGEEGYLSASKQAVVYKAPPGAQWKSLATSKLMRTLANEVC
jgi:hypothetical protein